jgi:hypothetical protein
MSKKINYIVDSKGKKTAVQIPIAEWKALQKKLAAKKTISKNKKTNSENNVESISLKRFLDDTKKGLEQIKLFDKNGKMPKNSKTVSDFLSEL